MKRDFLLSLLLAVLCTSASAIPAKRDSIRIEQPDGSFVTTFLRGDEHAHVRLSPDGYPLLRDKSGFLRYARPFDGKLQTAGSPIAHNPGQRTPQEQEYLKTLQKADIPELLRANSTLSRTASHRSGLNNNFPTTGTLKGLIILAEFSDNSFSHTRDEFDRMMNQEGYSEHEGTGSARDYFISQSMGKFTPEFDVIGPVKLSHDIAYYGANTMVGDKNPSGMVEEACKLADASCDFTKYDSDGDGAVDMVYVIYAGYGEHSGASENTIWPHKSALSNYGINLSLDGKKIDVYACSSEINEATGTRMGGIGSFCHEFGHVLGLADMYQTNNGGEIQLGIWSIMDYGCYNNDCRTPTAYSAFERYSVGWLNLTGLNAPQKGIELEELTTGNRAYRLSTEDENEYFILENRQPVGWDAYLPAGGLMVTHIDYDASAWKNNTVNNTASHPRVQIEAADNEMDYEGADDLYPSAGHDAFTDETTPSSVTWKNVKLNKRVTNITDKKGMVSFDFMDNYLVAPVAIAAGDITGHSFIANWQASDDATESYTLRINKFVPEAEAKTALTEDFSKMKTGSLNSPGGKDIAKELDSYTITPGWTGERVFQAGGYCLLGNYLGSGKLVTLNLDLSAQGGTFTIVITARPRTADKTTGLQVEACGKMAGHKLENEETTYVYVFNGGNGNVSISITTSGERSFLNDITVYRGDASNEYPSARVIAVSGTSAQVASRSVADDVLPGYVGEEIQCIKGIKDTSYKVEDLESECNYSYTVEAVSETTGKASFRSNEVAVYTQSTGIQSIRQEDWKISREGSNLCIENCRQGDRFKVYTVAGTLISDVFATTGKLYISLPETGVYVIQRNGEKAILTMNGER